MYICIVIVNLDIKDRDYKNISDYCEKNHLVLNNYLCDKIISGYTVDKYGAVPPMFATKTVNMTDNTKPEPVAEEPKVETVEEPKPKRKRTTKKKDDVKVDVEVKAEEPIEEKPVEEKPKPTRVKRTLKSK